MDRQYTDLLAKMCTSPSCARVCRAKYFLPRFLFFSFFLLPSLQKQTVSIGEAHISRPKIKQRKKKKNPQTHNKQATWKLN